MARRPSSPPQDVLIPGALRSEDDLSPEDAAKLAEMDASAAGGEESEFGKPIELDDEAEYYPTKDEEHELMEGDHDEPDGDEASEGPSAIDLEEFFENLAEDEKIRDELKTFCTQLGELIEDDMEARKPRDEQYQEGIQRTGLGDEAPGGAQFDGASRAVHPVLMEGCIDFAAKAIKELFPPNGPTRTKVIGKASKDKLARAERKRDFMNWQLTTQIQEFRGQLEQTLSQVPLGGSQYMHMWVEDRLRCQFVGIDNVFIPYDAESFWTASRVTLFERRLSVFDFQQRVKNGVYIDPGTMASVRPPELSGSEEATDKIEGKDEPGNHEEGYRPVVKVFIWKECEFDEHSGGQLMPYMLSMEWETWQVLEFRRNWDPTLPEGTQVERINWVVQWDFIIWRGALAAGLGQIIGSLAGSITGGVRALLDSAHINNAATLIKLKGANLGGQSTSVDITGIAEIEGPAGIDDIRKLAMPMPFNPPSEVLFKLVDWLLVQAKGAVATADSKIAEANQNTPVGTVMALIEQGSVTFSAIHARLHESMKRVLGTLHTYNKFWLEDENTIEELGELVVYREDFEGPLDIIPVSDPNIFSETQRVTQVQGLLELRTIFPGLMVDRVILKRALHTLKIPDVDDVLPAEYKPHPMNPVAENLQMFMGQPAFAFPDQDHEAHMQVHASFILDVNLGQNPAFITQFAVPFMEHMRQHIGFWYVSRSLELLSGLVGQDMSEVDYSSPDAQDALARAMAESAPMMMAESQRVLSQIGPLLAKTSEIVQQVQQAQMQQAMMANGKMPAAQDPSRMAEVQRKAERDKAELGMEGQRLQLEQQDRQSEMQDRQQQRSHEAQSDQLAAQMQGAEIQQRQDALRVESMHRDKDREVEQMALSIEKLAKEAGIQVDMANVRAKLRDTDVKLTINEQDNLTATTIAKMRLKDGKAAGVTNGNGLDRY